MILAYDDAQVSNKPHLPTADLGEVRMKMIKKFIVAVGVLALAACGGDGGGSSSGGAGGGGGGGGGSTFDAATVGGR